MLRVGRRVPRHVYDGDEPLFIAPTEALAREIIEAVNARRAGRTTLTDDDLLALVAARWPEARLLLPGSESEPLAAFAEALRQGGWTKWHEFVPPEFRAAAPSPKGGG